MRQREKYPQPRRNCLRWFSTKFRVDIRASHSITSLKVKCRTKSKDFLFISQITVHFYPVANTFVI